MEQQRVALVTGAGSGIGRAAAVRLSEAYVVVLAGRRTPPLQETAALIEAGGGSSWPRTCDVSDVEAVATLFTEVEARHGRLDLLFNNAGYGPPKARLDEIELRHWKRTLDVNVTGSFLCAQAAFRLMRRQDPPGGRIINNGSVASQTPRPWQGAYTASKHALSGLTKALSLDGRPFGIACGQIDIGNAATGQVGEMARGMMQADGSVRPEPTMDLDAVAEAVWLMARLPLEAHVQSMTVLASGMPFVGRG